MFPKSRKRVWSAIEWGFSQSRYRAYLTLLLILTFHRLCCTSCSELSRRSVQATNDTNSNDIGRGSAGDRVEHETWLEVIQLEVARISCQQTETASRY